MAETPHAERARTFDFAGLAGPVQVYAYSGVLRIVNGKKDLSVPVDSLLRIDHHPGSWRCGSAAPGLWIRFQYGAAGNPRKAEIALAADDPGLCDFLDYLECRFPARVCLGPNENERERILSPAHRGTYGLHALHVLTPAGIVTGMLLVCALVLSVILAESMPVRAVSEKSLQRALASCLALALIPASLMALILSKRLMAIRTDHGGLTVRRFFGETGLAWRDVEIGEPRSDAFNVYTGMFCWYSDRIHVVSSRGLVEIPVRRGADSAAVLRLNLEEAGPLFRELYYRGKVTLETAKKVGAFL
jgi:hypothetical protein